MTIPKRRWPIALLMLGVLLLGACKSAPEGREEAAVQLAPEFQAALEEGERQAALEEAHEAAANTPPPPPQLSTPAEVGSESPHDDGVHDPANEALAILQDPREAMADFPRDRRGQVDWVASLAEGRIEPRADLLGQSGMELLDQDILMKNTQAMPWVRFPHQAHTQWLDCTNCHVDIFEPQEGANDITMNKVLRGEYCGVCHGKVSFELWVCERCHSVPHPGSGEKWW